MTFGKEKQELLESFGEFVRSYDSDYYDFIIKNPWRLRILCIFFPELPATLVELITQINSLSRRYIEISKSMSEDLSVNNKEHVYKLLSALQALSKQYDLTPLQ